MCSHLQVNRHASVHGMQYGMISNILWSCGAFVMAGHNSMKILQPLRYDQTRPSVLQVCRHKLTEVVGKCTQVG